MKKIIGNVLRLAFFMACLGSCTGVWHLQQAKNKRPDLFEIRIDTVFAENPEVGTIIDCDTIGEEPMVFYFPVESLNDSVRVEFKTVYKYKDKLVDRPLTAADSLDIKKALSVVVKCPDCPIITKEVEVPVPVKPTMWEKLEYLVYVSLIALVVLGLWYGYLKRR